MIPHSLLIDTFLNSLQALPISLPPQICNNFRIRFKWFILIEQDNVKCDSIYFLAVQPT